MRRRRTELAPRIHDGDLFPGFESIPLYQGVDAAVGRTRVRRESRFWREPLPNPEQGVILAFPRRPYWVQTHGKPLAVTPHGVRVIASGRDVSPARSEHGFDVDNVWIHVTSDRLESDLRRANLPIEGAVAIRPGDAALGTDALVRLRTLVARLEGDAPGEPGSAERSISEIVVNALGRSQAGGGDARAEATADSHTAAVSRAKLFMAQNFAERLTLNEIARAAGLSRSHLCVVFRDLTGQSVHEFLNELRLREAVWLLPHYGRRIGELGVELGFNSASHFATAFRLRFGTAPREFAAAWRLT